MSLSRAKTSSHRVCRAAGFTMIELLVTMLLLTVVLTGLAALQLHSIRQVTSSRRANEATRLAQAQVERFRAMAFTQLPPSGASWQQLNNAAGQPMLNVSVNGEQGGPFSAHVFVEDPGSTPARRIITVRVSWLDVSPGHDPDPTKRYRTLNVMMSTQEDPMSP